MNPVTDYYVEQAGSGISGFHGIKYQRGNGIFSSIWAKIGLPVLKFLGRQAVSSGLSVASDAFDGRNIKDSAIQHLRQGGKNTVEFLKDLASQQGGGRIRSRKRKNKKKPIKCAKRRKTTSVKKRTAKKKQQDFIF